jgi:glucose/arabinose dehydrogenase/mono/diheme cytochrome c family protein
MKFKSLVLIPLITLTSLVAYADTLPLSIKKDEHIVLIGNGLGERMIHYPHFETDLQRRFLKENLIVRNLCFPGDTPGFRAHSSRKSQWAFPGAEQFHQDKLFHDGVGFYPTPDEWLTTVKADTILAFFGYNESFDGFEGLNNYYAELDAFITHTSAQKYNGQSAPRLILVSPIAFEDRSADYDLPEGKAENRRLAAYAETMRQVALDRGIGFIDVFSPSQDWYRYSEEPLTINGFLLNDRGNQLLAEELIAALLGERQSKTLSKTSRETVYEAVQAKNWYWYNDYRMLNDVHVHGRRHEPYGNNNYPEEIEKLREMTALRDTRIHALVQSKEKDLIIDDRRTRNLLPTETNYTLPIKFLENVEALDKFEVADGFSIQQFASESNFPDLKNPVQMSFDNKGRLWVSVMPSYPHWKPGDPLPNDKILIFEDTNGDGTADKQIVFADGLHLPMGFELAPEGVYVTQEPNLVLLVDDDGDDHADRTEILVAGFDSADTHHAISAYCSDASGAFYMCEGRFLHSQVETPYGPQRMTDGGAWRFDPHSWKLERFMQTDVNNPWGIAFDEWGQNFLADASGGNNWWSLPLSAKVPHGYEIDKVAEFTTFRVRPTSGAEFIYSRHFPDEYQGDFILNNTIGFLGTKQHKVWEDDEGGFTGELRQDLGFSKDPNFRPVDLEFAPDGSLYLVDWHNPLIGHMQHSARDPNRDHDHGRIYRITYPSRPLVKPVPVAGESISRLLENLKEPEYRTRYRTLRELRGRPAKDVIPAVRKWAASLDRNDPDYERDLLQALWVTWGQHQVDEALLRQCLSERKHQTRAAAVRVLRYVYPKITGFRELFLQATHDSHPRVRLEAIVASSWMDNEDGALIALEGLKSPITKWMGHAYTAVLVTLEDDIRTLYQTGQLDLSGNPKALEYLEGDFKPYNYPGKYIPPAQTNMPAEALKIFEMGREVYSRDAHCTTCHGEDGKGAIKDIYPPLVNSEWVREDDERLIKIILKGLWGPIEVAGKTYDPSTGVPPMTGFEHMLTDKEIAAVIFYVKNQFAAVKGIPAVPIDPDLVTKVRQEVKEREGFYMVEEILKDHPMTIFQSP